MATDRNVNVAIKGIELAVAVLQRVVAELRGPAPVHAPSLRGQPPDDSGDYVYSRDLRTGRTYRIAPDDNGASLYAVGSGYQDGPAPLPAPRFSAFRA